MKQLVLALGLALATFAPSITSADSPPARSEAPRDGRLIPAMRDGKQTGLKLYAIREGGRFDQPTAKFRNGDTIESVDGQPVTETAGYLTLYANVIAGKADATVVVMRAGTRVTLSSKAVR